MYVVLEKNVVNGYLVTESKPVSMYLTEIAAESDASVRTNKTGKTHYVCHIISETNVERSVVTNNFVKGE